MKLHVCVVGSGPSGLTAAVVLLKRGFKVSMLDYGNIPPGTSHARQDVYTTNVNRDELISVKDLKLKRTARETDVIPARADFKSSYFYADTNRHILGEKRNAIANISLAMGGLSALWGGAVLPAVAGDIADWPISVEDLRPHYREILEFLPISAEEDGLSRVFDFHAGSPHSFPPGPQALEFLSDLTSNRERLEEAGLYFGRAKLAVDPEAPLTNRNYSYGPIFNSAVAIQHLLRNPDFEYVPDLLVREIVESKDSVEIFAARKGGPTIERLKTGRAFIACGPIASSQIALKSMKWTDREFDLKTNQNIYMPFFRFKRHPGISRRPTENIIQLFMDIRNAETLDLFAHIQIYQYGDYVIEPVRRGLGRLTPLFVSAVRPFLERVMVMQFMLHSSLSDSVRIRLSYKKDEDAWKVDLQGKNNPRTPEACRRLIGVLNRHKSLTGGFAVKSILFIDPPGASNHMGGIFPMRKNPAEYETDLLGRLKGFQRVHWIDSSILPSLPATTLTYTIMANAARICHQAAGLS